MTEDNLNDDDLNPGMLRDLQRRTAELPREIAPPAEAWTHIKAQIDMESAARLSLPARRERAIWQRPSFLAAAAVLLVAATSLTTALVLGRRAMENAGQVVASAAAPQALASATPTLAQFTAMENDYIGTANRLSAIIESGQSELSPETIVKLKESLRVIDAAILEARRALAADPANKTLIEMLSTSYNQKVDLLRRTAEMGQS
jgi:hypothetical protein